MQKAVVDQSNSSSRPDEGHKGQVVSGHKDSSQRLMRTIAKYFSLLTAVNQAKILAHLILHRKSVRIPGTKINGHTSIPVLSGQPSITAKDSFAYLLMPPNQMWHLQALLGESVVNAAVETNGGQLTGEIVIDLLIGHPLPFYTDANERLLFLGDNKLAALELGPLKPISPVVAVQRYGLAKLEEASEKSYTRI